MYGVMIVDDEPWVREGITNLIDWNDHNMEILASLEDGIEALDYVRHSERMPDIVLTDIRMPEKSGLELIEALSELDHRVRFVILSGYRDFEYARSAIRFGVFEYLVKPIGRSALLNTMIRLTTDIQDEVSSTEGTDLAATAKPGFKVADHRDYAGSRDRGEGSNADSAGHSSQVRSADASADAAGDVAGGGNRADGTDSVTDAALRNNTTPANDTAPPQGTDLPDAAGSGLRAETPPILISRMLAALERHITEAVGLVELAEELSVNPSYLSALFSETMQETFKQYLTRRKVEKAKEIWRRHPWLKVYELCTHVGYTDVNYFSRIFKQVEGVTPRQFKQGLQRRRPAETGIHTPPKGPSAR